MAKGETETKEQNKEEKKEEKEEEKEEEKKEEKKEVDKKLEPKDCYEEFAELLKHDKKAADLLSRMKKEGNMLKLMQVVNNIPSSEIKAEIKDTVKVEVESKSEVESKTEVESKDEVKPKPTRPVYNEGDATGGLGNIMNAFASGQNAEELKKNMAPMLEAFGPMIGNFMGSFNQMQGAMNKPSESSPSTTSTTTTASTSDLKSKKNMEEDNAHEVESVD